MFKSFFARSNNSFLKQPISFTQCDVKTICEFRRRGGNVNGDVIDVRLTSLSSCTRRLSKETKQEVYVPNATLNPSVSSVVVLVKLLLTSLTSD